MNQCGVRVQFTGDTNGLGRTSRMSVNQYDIIVAHCIYIFFLFIVKLTGHNLNGFCRCPNNFASSGLMMPLEVVGICVRFNGVTTRECAVLLLNSVTPLLFCLRCIFNYPLCHGLAK